MVTKTQTGKVESKTMADGAKVLRLGSKHNRPATEIKSTVRSDKLIDPEAARKLKFFGEYDDKGNLIPKYQRTRWIPYLETGKDMSREQAMENIARFMDTLDKIMRADQIVVDGAEGVIWEGPASRCAAPKDITAAGYVCQLLAERIVLANQQEMNPEVRDEMVEAARKAGLYKENAPSERRTRTRTVV